MDTNFYDAVVCGPALAGVVSACLLAKRGLRVLLCRPDQLAPTFAAGGHLLPRLPGVLPPVDGETLGRVFKELNHVPNMRRRAPARQPGLVWQEGATRHVIPPRTPSPKWLPWGDNPAPPAGEPTDLMERTWERLHRVAAVLDSSLGPDMSLPPEGFWARREVARAASHLEDLGDPLRELTVDDPLRAGIGALAALTGGFAPGDVDPVAMARAFDHARRGLYLVDGGWTTPADLFTEGQSLYASDRRDGLTATEILFRRGQATALRVRPRDETVGLAHLIWAGPAETLATLCGERAPRRLRELATAVRPACYRYTLVLLVKGAPGDETLAWLPWRLVSVMDPGRPFMEENALLITRGAPGARDPGLTPVWIECHVPTTAASAGSGYLSVLRRRVRERLHHILPPLKSNLVVIASPHDGLPPEDGEGVLMGAPPLPVSPMVPLLSCDLPRALGISGLPFTTGIKNVTLASAEMMPGLGVEGEFVAGWHAARIVCEPHQRRGGFRRREILIADA